MDEKLLYTLPVLIFGLVAIAFAGWLARDVLGRDTGTPEMQKVSNAIYQGALAYLKRQYQTIALLAIVAAVVMGILVAAFEKEHQTARGLITGLSFIFGAALSGLAGFIGMYVAVRSNIRTAAAARRSLGEALTVSLRGGAVSGFLVIALGMLGVMGVYWIVYNFAEGSNAAVAETPFWIVGFAFGASFVALFAQLGGGIYTKAADVGADLVGKVEAGIPEDDPRNPAVIADLVGDNVGDCAGRGADLFESSAAEMIGAMILGVALYNASGRTDAAVAWIFFPVVTAAFGLIASMVGVLVIRPTATPKNPMGELNKGFYAVAGLSAIFLVGICYWMLPYGSFEYSICGIIGILTAIAFVYITQYYTSGAYRPVKEIAEASKTGPATNIISGISVGFETVALPAITIGAALFQTIRTALQQKLKAQLSTNGANFVRYLYGAPLSILMLVLLLTVGERVLPAFDWRFVAWTALGGMGQIIATSLLIYTFELRNFTVGTAYSKTETIQIALFGTLFLDAHLGLLAWAGILVCLIGVLVLSVKGDAKGLRSIVMGWTQKAALVGVAAGTFFSVAALGIRQAIETLPSGDFMIKAILTLALMNTIQTVVMGTWLLIREPGEIGRVVSTWRSSSVVGLTSVLGSAGWALGFALQNPALVRAVGQVELVFTFLASRYMLHERPSLGEFSGAILVVGGVVMVLLGR